MSPIARPAKVAEADLIARVTHAVALGRYRILPHARQRCTERDVAAADIEHALAQGRHVRARDRFDPVHAEWSYCFEGCAIDGESLRVVVALQDWLLIVTVVRLERRKEESSCPTS